MLQLHCITPSGSSLVITYFRLKLLSGTRGPAVCPHLSPSLRRMPACIWNATFATTFAVLLFTRLLKLRTLSAA